MTLKSRLEVTQGHSKWYHFEWYQNVEAARCLSVSILKDTKHRAASLRQQSYLSISNVMAIFRHGPLKWRRRVAGGMKQEAQLSLTNCATLFCKVVEVYIAGLFVRKVDKNFTTDYNVA